ncbi:acyl-homoserine-lactone synthase [Ruegeria lacuscaerulensis]|uniref:acyl-homoserine-lactone synthase n=1 Tax=Ruegeria lacuscaerulensis TaxID=55218 RepID=UPI00147D5609|nr:acyl-homoserine-lactone synthase [Ruegeria lacuscaerulensis]
MQAYVVDWHSIPKAGHLWNEYFQLRRDEFVGRKKWNLPHSERAEFDCYDTPFAEFIIVEHNGQCIAGARLLPTDAPNYGPYSYMLLDAQRGNISGIPKELIPEELPVGPHAFEATRFFVRRDIGLKTTIEAQRTIVQSCHDRVKERGGTHLLALMPTQIYRLFRKFGFDVEELNRTADIDETPHSVGCIRVA